MPGIVGDRVVGKVEALSELNSTPIKENSDTAKSSVSLPGKAVDPPAETSIERLYDNVCEIESSSDECPSPRSSGSVGRESRIDSELRHLVGEDMKAVEIIEEETGVDNGTSDMMKSAEEVCKTPSPSRSLASSKKSRRPSRSPLESDTPLKSSPNSKESPAALLKHARDLISSDNPRRALKFALRAAKAFENRAGGKTSLDLVMSLHVVAAVYCNLGQYTQAIPLLEQSIEIPVLEEGQEHALAKFSGYMQLGDIHSMLGQLECSIRCYAAGLKVQKQALGDMDPRVGETCRYLAEAHLQALQIDEAESLCRMALDIHKENGAPSVIEETADQRLMGLICETKGNHEAALEHLVLASMSMVANGQETEVASVDCSIGDIYLRLARYDEAVFAYEKALGVFKSSKGETHPTVASVFIRLAELYNKVGKFRESRSYCENALQIYGKPIPGTTPDEIASGLTNVSAIYESMNENEEAIKLLKKALKLYKNAPGQQSTVAGIEAQMGVLYYMTGNYAESYASFKNAINKLRACGERKSAFFGIALNQMGLACIQRYALNEATDLFEEARSILEQEYGPHHPETLRVCSNLAGTYDAMGRFVEAIEILEYVVSIREEKLGTANHDVDEEKRRLAELLKEAGRGRSRKARSLEALLDNTKPHTVNKNVVAA